jgi:hypothetical protein
MSLLFGASLARRIAARDGYLDKRAVPHNRTGSNQKGNVDFITPLGTARPQVIVIGVHHRHLTASAPG